MHALFVTVDAGGNLPPLLGIAAATQRRGGTVTVLGHPYQRSAVEAAGLAFTPYATAGTVDPRVHHGTLGGLVAFLSMATDRRIGADAVATAGRVGADVVVVDALATGGLEGVVASGLPTASLVHTPEAFWTRLQRGPVGRLMRLRGLNAVRVQSSPALRLLVSRPDLDPVVDLPERTRQVGVVWQGHPVAAQSQTTPRVLVSLSTTAFPGQDRTLQHVLDALGELPVEVVATTGPTLDPAAFRVPANASVHAWVDHAELLPTTSLVVGHGGWSTTTRALSYGVPVLAVPSHPMLDQPLVGAMLERTGLGASVDRKAVATGLAPAVTRLLGDAALRQRVSELGADIRSRDGAEAAVDALVALAPQPSAP